MNLKKISFRTTAHERQFLAVMNQKYQKKTATDLLHAVLREYAGTMGIDLRDSSKPRNNDSSSTTTVVMPDSVGQQNKQQSEIQNAAGYDPDLGSKWQVIYPLHNRSGDKDKEWSFMKYARLCADFMEQMARIKKARDELYGVH
jgi:ADP-heptose:LPS heptosyltransferase